MTLGTWIKFTRVEEKGISVTSADLMHGKVVSIGEQVKLPLKAGQKIVVSTTKNVQDLQEGQRYYYVQDNQVIDTL